MIPPSEIKELNLKDYFDIIRKRRWVVVAFMVVIVGGVAAFDLSSPKVYVTKATVLLKESVPRVTGKEGVVYSKGAPTRETQLTLLKSQSLGRRVAKKLGLISEFVSNNAPEDAARIARSLRRKVAIAIPDRKNEPNIIDIVVRGKDPLGITNLANTWWREFQKEDMDQRSQMIEAGIEKLQERIADTLDKLQKAERDLNDFLKENRIVSIPELGVKKEGLIEGLKKQRTALEKEIIEKSETYKDKHPQMVVLKTKLKAIEEKLKEETDALFDLQDKSLQYRIFKRETANYKSLYESLARRVKELALSQEMIVSNVRVLEEAQPPTRPVRPRPKKDISTAAILSFLLGVVVCFSLEYFDSTLRTSDDVEFYTKMPFLGYIPSAKKVLKEGELAPLVTHSQLSSQVAEAVRNVRVSLIFSSTQDKPLKTIVVTSSVPQEGKTVISSNLAIAFAQAKEKTLLLDADMRRGGIAKTFGLSTDSGLTSVLAGISSLEEVVVSTCVPNLCAVGCGPYAPNPMELLNSQKLKETLRQLEEKFDRIIIDSPPLLSVADALLLGSNCDGITFVVRAGFTDLKSVLEAKKILGSKVKVIGAILNNVEIEKDRYYYYH